MAVLTMDLRGSMVRGRTTFHLSIHIRSRFGERSGQCRREPRLLLAGTRLNQVPPGDCQSGAAALFVSSRLGEVAASKANLTLAQNGSRKAGTTLDLGWKQFRMCLGVLERRARKRAAVDNLEVCTVARNIRFASCNRADGLSPSS